MMLLYTLTLSLLTFSVSASNFTIPKFYQPYSGESPFEQSIHITKTKNGACLQQSINDKRKNAYRCKAEGEIYDPCFHHSFNNDKTLICPKSPWSASAVKIKTKQRLNNSNHSKLDMSRSMPWAVELIDGTRCLIIGKDKNKPYRYHCQHQQFLMGNIYRCKGIWEIYLKNQQQYKTAYIKKAWF